MTEVRTTHPAHSSENVEQALQRFSSRVKDNWLFLLIGLIGGGIIFSGDVVRATKDIYETVVPHPDSLSLFQEQSKDQISREFVETTFSRVYRSRNFLARLRKRATASEINDAWKALLQSVEEMATKQMLFAVYFGKFYSEARRLEYEDGIQIDFNDITTAIVDLRYSATVKKLEFPQPAQSPLTKEEQDSIDKGAAAIEAKLDTLQIRLYHFAGCFDEKHQTPKACEY